MLDSHSCRSGISTGPIAAGRESLPKRRKSVEKVENPRAAVRKSLPKQRKTRKKVENPEPAYWKSLPKQRKTGEKSRKPQVCFSEISTQTAGNSLAGSYPGLASSHPSVSSAHTPASPAHIFSIVSSHILLQASLGMRRSPLGEMATEPTLGPSGRQERLNCWLKKRR